jgi:ABC-2 type transport system permease protein
MLNFRTKAVLKREIKTQIFSKAFLFMTILMPVIIFGVYAVMGFVMTVDQDKVSYISVTSDSPEMLQQIEAELSNSKSKLMQFAYIPLEGKSVDNFVDDNRTYLLNDSITGVIHVPSTSFGSKEVSYYSSNPKNVAVRQRLRSALNSVFLKNYFKQTSINEEQVKYIKKGVEVNSVVVTEDATEEDSGVGKMIVAGLFAFFLYLSVLMIGMAVMRSTTEEKINRVVEVLLSSVSSRELMQGKIIGSALTGLAQMLIWTSPIIVVSLVSATALPLDIEIDISFSLILYFLTNYVIGLITFVSLFAAVGSIFDNDQDAQQGVMPLMMLIMIPFYIAMALFANPANSFGVIASMVPFASIIVMPVRMTLIDVPLWQLALQLFINAGVMYLCIVAAGKIYRIGVLFTGKKPKWSEVLRWIKQS